MDNLKTLIPKKKAGSFCRLKRLSRTAKCLPLLSMLFVSCAGNDVYDFGSSEDALGEYKNYLISVRNIKKSNTSDFTKELSHWKEVNDTVVRFLLKDSTLFRDHNTATKLNIIHDSVRHEMLRISETWRYSYDDVLKIKQSTSRFHNDKDLQQAVNDAEPFFIALNELPVIDIDKSAILTQYRQFLTVARNEGINSKDDMLAFIKHEDIFFRSFLAHLYEMDNEPISDITKQTEQVCNMIFLAAREGKITARDAMVYMSMRTVRRLLQNSIACMSDINKQQMKNPAQGNAYVWMIIQPFISIDQFSMATLTPTEKSNFNYIVSQLPKSTKFAKAFDIEQRSLNYLLPQQLLKIYILSL